MTGRELTVRKTNDALPSDAGLGDSTVTPLRAPRDRAEMAGAIEGLTSMDTKLPGADGGRALEAVGETCRPGSRWPSSGPTPANLDKDVATRGATLMLLDAALLSDESLSLAEPDELEELLSRRLRRWPLRLLLPCCEGTDDELDERGRRFGRPLR